MQHIAIDLGGRESQICVRNSDGTILDERRHRTASIPAYLKTRPQSRVILESCSEAFAIADAALELGHEVRVVPATLVRTLGVGARGIKTDRRDAQVLSEVSCRIELPSVHVPSMISRALKSNAGMRSRLVEARTQLVNSVRGWLRTQLMRLRSGAVESFTTRVRNKLLSGPDGMPDFVERQLLAIDELCTQIKAADKELKDIAARHIICQRLMTTPGVGVITSLRFVAALDDISRFPNAHAVESYLGLTPGERSSSDRHRRTGITKAGSSEVRRMLVQACWSAWRAYPGDPMVKWAKQVAERRGRPVAIVAMARKLAGILYAVWRDGAEYEPRRLTAAAGVH